MALILILFDCSIHISSTHSNRDITHFSVEIPVQVLKAVIRFCHKKKPPLLCLNSKLGRWKFLIEHALIRAVKGGLWLILIRAVKAFN